MSKYDVKINLKSLDGTIDKMANDLDILEEETNNINNAYLFLDETKWQGIDKNKIDSGFGNYLKKMTNFSNELRDTLNVLKDAYTKYEDIDIENNKMIEELEEL